MAYQYELVLFDMDGTLTDSGLGIMNSVQYALKKIVEKFYIVMSNRK